MATTLGDVKIKLTLDTAEAEARIRRLEEQIKVFKGDYPTRADVRQRGFSDAPSERDDEKRAATSTTAVAAASTPIFSDTTKAVMKGAVTAEVVLAALQQTPLLMKVLEETVLKQFENTPGYKYVKEGIDGLAAKVDEIQGKIFKILPSAMQTFEMGKGALRLGMGVSLTDAYNMYNFMMDVNAKNYQVEKKVGREINKGVIETFLNTTVGSLNR